jgi:hypothetical protein
MISNRIVKMMKLEDSTEGFVTNWKKEDNFSACRTMVKFYLTSEADFRRRVFSISNEMESIQLVYLGGVKWSNNGSSFNHICQ